MRRLLFSVCCLLCASFGLASEQFRDYDNLGRPLFRQGEIAVKVKEGLGPFAKQDGLVHFGLSSLDALVQQFEIQSLAPRFKHQPIDSQSGLPDLSRIYRVTFSEQIDLWSVVEAFAADPQVEYAEPIPCAYVAEVPNDPLYVDQQHLPQIEAALAWDIHHGEDGTEPIVVAIIDTGVDYNHPDLTDNVWQNLGEDGDGDGQTLIFDGDNWILDPGDLNGIDDDDNGFVDDLIGWDFHNETEDHDNDPADVDGHGTHCAGIAAGVTDNGIGIASISWNVEVMFTKHNNNDPPSEIVDGYDGILYAAQNGADIISCSWGGTNESQANLEVIQVATGLGSIVIAAAHNFDADSCFFPAAWPGAISVAAVDVNDVKTSYSNFGMWIDIAAPGGDSAVDGGILSTIIGGGYDRMSGTSMATPMVAGFTALVKSYHPDWTNEQIVTQIFGTADDISSLNPEYENLLGAGRINAFRGLDETGVSLPQALRVELSEFGYQDTDGDQIIEPGEVVDLDLTLRNYAHYVGDDDAVLTLTSDDPEVTVLSDSWTGPLPADDYLELSGHFQIHIAEDATTHETRLTFALDSDLEVLFGQEMYVYLNVAPAGVLVWEGIADGQDHSGIFIRDTLEEFGLEVTYTNQLPHNFLGYHAVFMSQGNTGEFLEKPYVQLGYDGRTALLEYLEHGGNVYYEFGCLLTGLEYLGDPRIPQFMQLFGVEEYSTDLWNPVPIDTLRGQPNTVAQDMVFHESTQVSKWYIDQFVPDENGTAAFFNTGYGDVAVQAEGEYGQKTFLFSYSLADLVDEELPSTRERLLGNLASFFGLFPDGVEDDTDLPAVPVLAGNYPNPFNPSTEIKFSLSQSEEVEIGIFSLNGRRVRTLVNKPFPAGWHAIRWNGRDATGRAVASGVYFVRLRTETASESLKIMLVK